MNSLDKYYKSNQKSGIFRVLFDKIANENNLDILENIIMIEPNYDIRDFDKDFFSKDLVEAYGYKFLISNQRRIKINLLKMGIKNPDLKEKILYFSKYDFFKEIKLEHILNNAFSIERFEKLINVFDRFELICFLKLVSSSSDMDIEELFTLLEKKEQFLKIKYLLTHVNELLLKDLLRNKDIILDRKGTIFIYSLINSNFDLLLFPNKFFSLYNKYKHLFTDERLIEAKTLTAFLKDVNRDKYNINNASRLINFYSIRDNYYKKHNEYENEIKSKFGISLQELRCLANKYLEKNKTMRFLTKDEEILLNRVETLEYGLSLLKIIEEKYRLMCKKSIINNIIVPSSKHLLVDITRSDFRAIIHELRFGNKMASEFMRNPGIWNDNYVNGAYISGTLVDQFSLGTIGNSKQNILGFSNIKADDIIDMGLVDIYSSIYYYHGNLVNPNTSFAMIEDFNNSTKSPYNEITLRRFDRNKVSLKPDFTLAFDEINEFNKIVRDYFGISIFYINSFESAKMMNEHNLALLKEEELIQYGIYLYKFYTSYMYNKEIINRYFNINVLNKTLDELMKIINQNNKNAILFIINIIEKINSCLKYNDSLAETVDTDYYIKKIRI